MLPIVTVIGRVGRDPETVETKNGNKLLKFSVAADRRKNDDRGPMWVNINVWNGLEGNMPIAKGSALTIVGYLDTNVYTNKNGETVTSLEVNASSIDYALTGGGRKEDGNAPSENTSRRSSAPKQDDGAWGGNDNEFEW